MSTHFWEKLTGKSSGNAMIPSNNKQNQTWKYINENFDQFYNRVRRWTRNVDLFEKSTIIVPMNENQHWFLCVVTNLSTVFQLCKSGEMKDIIDGKSSGRHRQDATLKILFLDSMRNPPKYKKRFETMKKYIVAEAKDKHKLSDEEAQWLTKACIQQMPKVPQQMDGASCGLFMLEFIERILTDRNYHESMEPEDGSLWFRPEDVNGDIGRDKIMTIFKRLEQVSAPWIQQDKLDRAQRDIESNDIEIIE